MKKILNEGYEIHNFISSSGSDFLTSYGSDLLTSYGSGSASQKVTVPTVPVPVPESILIVFLQSWNF
jgi:hypothetical protein